MSETVARQRPSVDMDDFERSLRTQGYGQPTHPQYAHDDDPLAELARIVGEQPDPYGDVFAQQPVAASQHADLRASYDPHGQAAPARHEPSLGAPPPRFLADFAAIEAGLRGAAPPTQPHAPEFHAAGFQTPDFQTPEFQADRRGEYADEPEAHYAPQTDTPPIWTEPAKPSRSGSRRPVYAMAASIAIAVVGIGVAFAYKGPGSSPREIRTIMAAAGPIKEQPPVDQATAAADQDASASQTPSTKLVSREEQPVDLAQAVQDNAAARGGADAANVPVPASPGQAAGTMSPDYSSLGGATPNTSGGGSASPAYGNNDQAGFGVGMPKPKRVKSVSVTPDGRIVNAAAASDAAPNEAPTKSSDRAGPVTGSPLFPAQAPKSANRATKTSARRVAAAPPADQNANDGADDTPAPKPAKPAKKAKPVKLASAETGAAEPADSTATEDTKPSGGAGGFAVQLAAPGSESDARSATSSLLKKYSGTLSGRRLGFHRADSNGHTVYRVRVSSLSKEEATSLCSKLKSSGGSCFVAKN